MAISMLKLRASISRWRDGFLNLGTSAGGSEPGTWEPATYSCTHNCARVRISREVPRLSLVSQQGVDISKRERARNDDIDISNHKSALLSA